jgi:hypothetical protein
MKLSKSIGAISKSKRQYWNRKSPNSKSLSGSIKLKEKTLHYRPAKAKRAKTPFTPKDDASGYQINSTRSIIRTSISPFYIFLFSFILSPVSH